MGRSRRAISHDAETSIAETLLNAYAGSLPQGAVALYQGLLPAQSSPIPVDLVLAYLAAAELAASSNDYSLARFALGASERTAQAVGFVEPIPHQRDRDRLQSQLDAELTSEEIRTEEDRLNTLDPPGWLNRIIAWADQLRFAE